MEHVLCEVTADWVGCSEQLLMPMVSSLWMVSTFQMLGWLVGARIKVLVASVVDGGSVTLRGSPAIVVAAAGTIAGATVGGCFIDGPTLSGGSGSLCSLFGGLQLPLVGPCKITMSCSSVET